MSRSGVHVVYLHGFASGPGSRKALNLQRRLHGEVDSFLIPALDGGDFSTLTWDGMVVQARAALAKLPADDPVIILGSSLGGYLATWLIADGLNRPHGAVLIAPAFGFTVNWAHVIGAEGLERWRSDGTFSFYHHPSDQDVALDVSFLDSVAHLPAFPSAISCPLHIIHGRSDSVVPARVSEDYAHVCTQSSLHIIPGDHGLTEPWQEDLMVWCVCRLISNLTAE